MSDEPVVLMRFNYRHEGEVALGYLRDAEIPSAFFVDDAGGADVGLAFSNPGRLVVPGDRVDEAREVLSQAGILGDDPEDDLEDGPEDEGGAGTE